MPPRPFVSTLEQIRHKTLWQIKVVFLKILFEIWGKETFIDLFSYASHFVNYTCWKMILLLLLLLLLLFMLIQNLFLYSCCCEGDTSRVFSRKKRNPKSKSVLDFHRRTNGKIIKNHAVQSSFIAGREGTILNAEKRNALAPNRFSSSPLVLPYLKQSFFFLQHDRSCQPISYAGLRRGWGQNPWDWGFRGLGPWQNFPINDKCFHSISILPLLSQDCQTLALKNGATSGLEEHLGRGGHNQASCPGPDASSQQPSSYSMATATALSVMPRWLTGCFKLN